jgi:hypothetical protein
MLAEVGGGGALATVPTLQGSGPGGELPLQLLDLAAQVVEPPEQLFVLADDLAG